MVNKHNMVTNFLPQNDENDIVLHFCKILYNVWFKVA